MTGWPEAPSLRFLARWLVRREELCRSPRLCNDHPSVHAEDCPAGLLEHALEGWRGQLIRRAADLRFALDVGVRMTLDEIQADEFVALKAIKAEQEQYLEERSRQGR